MHFTGRLARGSQPALRRRRGADRFRRSIRRPVFEPDLTASFDDRVHFRARLQESGECPDEPADARPAEGEALRDADDAVGRCAAAQRLGQKRSEVAEVARDDGPLLVGQRCEMDPVGPASQIGPFANRDDVVALGSELAGDLGGEVLVEEQPQADSASCAARHLASSAAFKSATRLIHSSMSAWLAP